jgi:hypothetical protein
MTVSTTEECKMLNTKYFEIRKNACEWEDSLVLNYTEDQIIMIMLWICQWENQYNGLILADNEVIDESLIEDVKIGIEFAKLCLDTESNIRKLEYSRQK